MTHLHKTFIAASLVFGMFALVLGVAPTSASAASKHITIGTGGITGVYFPTGGAICRLVNRGKKDHGIRCMVESTGGSVYNINAIRRGDLDLGVAQSDWQYHAVKGTSGFAELGPFEDLRSVFSLHSEPFTVVARKDTGIESFDDLKDKRVNIGNPGSGSRATMEVVMDAKGWTTDVFKLASELKASEQGQALCDNKIDAFVHATGHPNGLLQEVTTSCETVLVNVTGPEIDALVNDNPFYSYATIPGGMYNGNPDDVTSFGVKATFVSSSEVDEELIYEVVSAVFDNFDDFKTLHPVFSTLDPEAMTTEALTAPMHEGAMRYFVEKGIMTESSDEDDSDDMEDESEEESSEADE